MSRVFTQFTLAMAIKNLFSALCVVFAVCNGRILCSFSASGLP